MKKPDFFTEPEVEEFLALEKKLKSARARALKAKNPESAHRAVSSARVAIGEWKIDHPELWAQIVAYRAAQEAH